MSNCHFSAVSQMTSHLHAYLPFWKGGCHFKLSLQWSVWNDVPNEVSFSCLPTILKRGLSFQIVTSVKCLKWRPKWGLIFMPTYQSKQFCHIKLSLQWRVPNDVPNEGLICMPTYQSKMVLSCQIVTSVKCLKWHPKWGLICMPTYQSKTGLSCQIVHFSEVSQMTSQMRSHFHAYLAI